jgi:RNA 3'-terminal phosphate cyclase (ATP)
MITIDGAYGEGGGQILRSALTLALVTGRPFRIGNIRGGRARPGLLRQHLTCVHAAARIGDATVEGAALGSTCLQFQPRTVSGGDYAFSIGSAGSTTLVLQTVLLPLARLGQVSQLVLTGGTHNQSAPPFDFLQHSFLPLLRRMGFVASATLRRAGFYPAGGGEVAVSVFPADTMRPLVLEERGARTGQRAEAVVANLPWDIARREVAKVGQMLNWNDDDLHARSDAQARGPGNVLMLTLEHRNVTEIVTAFGQLGKAAEQVASEAAREARRYLATPAPVGPHLADQLLLPMALGAGGRFVTTALTPHATTNIAVIRQFLGMDIAVTPAGDDSYTVTVPGAS